MTSRLNKKTQIIIAVITIVLLAVGIVCGLVFRPKKSKPKTTAEWLKEFSESLETAMNTKDESGNVLPVNIERRIEIKEDGVVVATYKQQLQTNKTDRGFTGYLIIEEKYPSQETTVDDVCEEYYFYDGVMYTKRTHGKEVQASSFDSEIDILITVADENIGNTVYNFVEENFIPIEAGGQIISQKGDEATLYANVNPDKYEQFFGADVDVSDMTDLGIEMKTVKGKFKSFALRYTQDNKSAEISLAAQSIVTISKPDWV